MGRLMSRSGRECSANWCCYDLGRVQADRAQWLQSVVFFFFKQKTAYEIGLGIPAEPLFRSFIVFDTLTLADDRLEAFYDNPNALRDYFRDIGRMVLAAEGRKANDSHADCYQYFCVPEYGTANGRLHFHAVHFMRTLPTGSVDPNFGRRVRNRRQLNSLQNTWPYGYSMPIAVRYTQDAFSRSGWLWPVDAKGEPLKATS